MPHKGWCGNGNATRDENLWSDGGSKRHRTSDHLSVGVMLDRPADFARYSMPNCRWMASSETPLVSGMNRQIRKNCSPIIAEKKANAKLDE